MLKDIILSYEFSMMYKILLSLVLCAIIGLERQSWNKPAGFKTHIIIGLSATLVMLIGEYTTKKYGASVTDPMRLPSQLLSGIGFIGAGTILRDGFKVKGLTTAASILGVTCIGLAVGMGFYFAAIVVTFILYFVLSYGQIVTEAVIKYNHMYVTIKVGDMDKETITNLKNIIVEEGIKITYIRYKKSERKNSNFVVVKGKYKSEIDLNDVVARVSSLEYVDEIIQEFKEE